MAASFPAAQKSFAQQTDDVSPADAADVNAIYDEVEAVEGHLGAGSIAAGQILLNSASGTDPWLQLQINSVEKFRIGVDDSDSDKFKIHTGALADPSYFEMSSTGAIELTNAAETASDPGRHLYLQRTHTGTVGSGKGLTGIEVRSTFNGSADALTSEVKGGEFKARHTTGNTYDVGTFKGVIGNVDCKNGTVTTGWAVEGAIDVSSGGTFTTAACFHGNLNNSGTVTNSYGVYVHGLSGNVLTRGLYVDYATTGLYLDNCTTDVRLSNGATLVNAADDGGTLTITEDNIMLVGGGWGKIAFGGYTDWGTGATGTDIDGTGYDWVTSTVGHLDSGALATAIAAAYHAMTVTVNQTTATSVFGTWTELYFKNSVDLGGSNNYASVWGQMEGGTNVTSPDTGMFMAAFYGNVKMGSTLTIASGVAVNGFRAQAEISAVTNNGRLAAFECLKSGGVDWEYGLYLANMTTGINIGACTDGIIISGACGSNGIEISGVCTGNAINITNQAGAVVAMTTAPTGASAVHGINVTMTDATATSGGDGSGLHLGIKYTGDHTGSGWKTALAIDYEIEGNNSYCFAESIWMGDGANATIGSLSGLYVYMEDKNAAATISNKFALDLNVDDTTSATLSGFMRVYSHGTGAVGSVIYLGNSGANKITNFLDFAAGVEPFSAGAPADMTADGKIACDIGGSTYYIAMYAA